MSELTSEQKLHRKLFAARKAAEAVAKHGDAGEFKFARFEDVLAEASKQLDKRSVHIVPEVVNEELKFSASGFAIATVVMEFEVIDTKDWGSLRLRWSGTGEDKPGDKALFKAQTGCEKYFLAKLLRIPFGTDPEEKEGASEQSTTVLEIPPESEADRVRVEQDRDAEAPQVPPRHLRPLPKSDLPEPDWTGLDAEEKGAPASV